MKKRQKDGLKSWAKKIHWDQRVKAVCKPCWELKYCPYGPLVEDFPLPDRDDERSCIVFGHQCPVFFIAEPLTETRELRNISRRIPRPMQFRVLKRDNQICAVCEKSVLDNDIHFDHIIPWSKGGPTEEHNIRLLCGPCNLKRGATFEGDYLITRFGEHEIPPVDQTFVRMLLLLVSEVHKWRGGRTVLPSAKDVCALVGVRKVTDFEESVAQTIADIDDIFRSKAPVEIRKPIFKAISDRWGFGGDAHIKKLQVIANTHNIAVNDLVSAEMALFRRLGFPVKNTTTERSKWAKL